MQNEVLYLAHIWQCKMSRIQKFLDTASVCHWWANTMNCLYCKFDKYSEATGHSCNYVSKSYLQPVTDRKVLQLIAMNIATA